MIIEIDRKCGVPAYQQVADALSLRILTGRLAGGDVLPSVKELAVQLGLNPSVVRRAYDQLRALGLAAGDAGHGGPRVAEAAAEAAPPELVSDVVGRALDRVVRTAHDLGLPAEGLFHILQSLVRERYGTDQ